MYVPAYAAFDGNEARTAFCRANPFALMVAMGAAGFEAVHLPLLVRPGEDGAPALIEGHVARANPLAGALADPDGIRVMCVFSGPHAYISPRDYLSPGLVPTWNYEAVHLHGTTRPAPDTRASLARLAAAFEQGRENPWTMEEMEPRKLDALMGALVAFEIDVTRIEAKAKLSQNRKRADLDRAAARLMASPDHLERATGRAMAKAAASA